MQYAIRNFVTTFEYRTANQTNNYYGKGAILYPGLIERE